MSDTYLVVIALRASDSGVAEKIQDILHIAKPAADPPETEGHVWYRKLASADADRPGIAGEGELTAADLDRLAAIIGWEAVERLNVGLPWGVVDNGAEGAPRLERIQK